jgi:hypothetical protein
MKNSIFKVMLCLIAIMGFKPLVYGQSASNNLNLIGLTSYIPDQIENVPEGAKGVLMNKLNQISSENGISNSEYNSRFIITPTVVVLNKDILASAPPMTSLNLDVTLYIGDGFEGKKYASKTLSVKGVGINENKAYIDAFKNIKPNNPVIQALVNSAKIRIIDYYNSRCEQIIKEAQTLASLNNLDEAIVMLAAIPEECTDCFNKGIAVIVPIYKNKIDRDCKLKLAQANNLWNANPTYETANTVAQIISSIEPQSACYGDVKDFAKSISKRILEVDKREWNFVFEKEITIEKDKIKAYRDVGVEYGKGQPKSNVYNVTNWYRP